LEAEKERDHLEDLGIGEKILDCILGKLDEKVWNE
jgi:hypothetical protein